MKQFNSYTVEDFNIVFGTDLTKDMTFQQVTDEIENEEVGYFYVSLNPRDVLQAIEDEKEVAKALDLRLIHIEGVEVYIATY